MKNREIKVLSDREHIYEKTEMYAGSVSLTKNVEYIFENNKIIEKEIEFVPALIKIINEIIDNSIDVHLKTPLDCEKIVDVTITDKKVVVIDNGRGITIKKNKDDVYLPRICWGFARSGGNFNKNDNIGLGTFGVGSYITNVLSKSFTGYTDDGNLSYSIKFKNNAKSFEESINSSKKHGTKVVFYPDLARFGLDIIDDNHKEIIKQRLMNLNISFPKIKFKFNGKTLNINSFKKYVGLFSSSAEVFETEDYSFAIMPNNNDDFRHFSFVNGLKISDGGSHIDYIITEIVTRMRTKLSKKYDIKNGDIKNKLFIIAFLKNFENPKFNSQSKEKITNSFSEIKQYLGFIDFDKLVSKILKNNNILEPIIDVYKIKEELKKQKEIQTLSKTKKKITDSKYVPAIKNNSKLILAEGKSALGGISSVLGREEYGYIALRGVPLSAYTKTVLETLKNVEMKLITDVLGLDLYYSDPKPEGDWYELEIEGKKLIVNENDTISIDNKKYDVKDLIE